MASVPGQKQGFGIKHRYGEEMNRNPTGKQGPKLSSYIRAEVGTILEEMEFEPFSFIVDNIRLLEAIYLEKQDTLTFQEHTEYFQTIFTICEKLCSYTHSKRTSSKIVQDIQVFDYNYIFKASNQRAGIKG